MSKSRRRLYPEGGPKRWDAVTRLALADTMFESTVMLVMEAWWKDAIQRPSVTNHYN